MTRHSALAGLTAEWLGETLEELTRPRYGVNWAHNSAEFGARATEKFREVLYTIRPYAFLPEIPGRRPIAEVSEFVDRSLGVPKMSRQHVEHLLDERWKCVDNMLDVLARAAEDWSRRGSDCLLVSASVVGQIDEVHVGAFFCYAVVIGYKPLRSEAEEASRRRVTY